MRNDITDNTTITWDGGVKAKFYCECGEKTIANTGYETVCSCGRKYVLAVRLMCEEL